MRASLNDSRASHGNNKDITFADGLQNLAHTNNNHHDSSFNFTLNKSAKSKGNKSAG